jgi:hypothetical protein
MALVTVRSGGLVIIELNSYLSIRNIFVGCSAFNCRNGIVNWSHIGGDIAL